MHYHCTLSPRNLGPLLLIGNIFLGHKVIFKLFQYICNNILVRSVRERKVIVTFKHTIIHYLIIETIESLIPIDISWMLLNKFQIWLKNFQLLVFDMLPYHYSSLGILTEAFWTIVTEFDCINFSFCNYFLFFIFSHVSINPLILILVQNVSCCVCILYEFYLTKIIKKIWHIVYF